jgi:hypothetical protein
MARAAIVDVAGGHIHGEVWSLGGQLRPPVDRVAPCPTPVNVAAETMVAVLDMVVGYNVGKTVLVKVEHLDTAGRLGGQLGTPLVRVLVVGGAPEDAERQAAAVVPFVVRLDDIQLSIAIQIGHGDLGRAERLQPASAAVVREALLTSPIDQRFGVAILRLELHRTRKNEI